VPSGILTTSSKLKAGVLNFFSLSLYSLCFNPKSFYSISYAIPLCEPFSPFFYTPPAAVTATCIPQQITKFFLIF
jgi:hypothetical protein